MKCLEEYIVKVTYQKHDGFWVQGEEVSVLVPINNGKEKVSHQLAEGIILERHPGCKIHSVNYV